MAVDVRGRNVWKFLQKAAKDAYNLTDYMSRHLETSAQLLKKCPDKWSVFLRAFFSYLASDTVSTVLRMPSNLAHFSLVNSFCL